MSSRKSSGSSRERRRAHKVREHHRHLAAFGAVLGTCAWGTRRGRCVSGSRGGTRIATKSGNGTEEHPAMANGTDADFLQVLLCQVREDPLVDFVIAECRLVFFEAQVPQPDHNVHDGRPSIMVANIICWGSEGVQG